MISLLRDIFTGGYNVTGVLFIAAHPAVETAAEIWRTVLSVDRVSIHVNFFAQHHLRISFITIIP
jgi:hypothetical protein